MLMHGSKINDVSFLLGGSTVFKEEDLSSSMDRFAVHLSIQILKCFFLNISYEIIFALNYY